MSILNAIILIPFYMFIKTVFYGNKDQMYKLIQVVGRSRQATNTLVNLHITL